MIDYEAIAVQAGQSTNSLPLGVKQTKAIIEAYERQKAAPEWVPLDLATVQQGQEVRISTWDISVNPHRFVATYRNETIVEAGGNLHRYKKDNHSWLMRAPKPKTVRVGVYRSAKNGEAYAVVNGELPLDGDSGLLGEGEIEVRE